MGNITRHSEFWFDDGNIVLVAQNIGFRVYRGLLAAQSTVFADMLSASSSSADETLDGCPIVHLTDSPHNVGHLLRVLLPRSPIRYHATDPKLNRSFDELFSVVRLAHKYHIQLVEDQAIHALQEHYFASYFRAPGAAPPTPRISFTRAQCIGVVNLARLTNASSLLPTALYACCYLRGALLDGWTHEDGTVEHLCTEDLKRCVHASITLGQEQLLILSRVFEPVPPQYCRAYGRCAPYVNDVVNRVVPVEDLTILGPLGDWAPWIRRLENLCGGCVGVLLERTGAERRQIWDALPELLGITIEGWSKPDGEGGEGEAGAA